MSKKLFYIIVHYVISNNRCYRVHQLEFMSIIGQSVLKKPYPNFGQIMNQTMVYIQVAGVMWWLSEGLLKNTKEEKTWVTLGWYIY